MSAWHTRGAVRNEDSSWVAVHAGSHWPMDWVIKPGNQPGTWRVVTTHHAAGQQVEGWGLSAWRAQAVEDENDKEAMVPLEAAEVEGTEAETETEATKAGEDATRNGKVGSGNLISRLYTKQDKTSSTSWVAVHSGDDWPMDWVIEWVRDAPAIPFTKDLGVSTWVSVISVGV